MADSGSQRTLAGPSRLVRGLGLHSGRPMQLRLLPAAPDSGLQFVRTDLSDERIACRADAVVNTFLATTIANGSGAKVSTVEHLLSALWASGIDNALIEVSGPEVPIMDGSAAPFLLLIDDAGVIEQKVPRRLIRIVRRIEVSSDDGSSRACLEAHPGQLFEVEVEFEHPLIRGGGLEMSFDASCADYRIQIAAARTFGFADQIDWLREQKRALGGSLNNALVFDRQQVLNQGGLRFANECVRHKILDAIGDCFISGQRIVGRYVAHRPGHSINNLLMRKLAVSPDNFETIC